MNVKSNGIINNNDQDKQCRICFQNDETISPLISPCSCTGSLKIFIHYVYKNGYNQK